MLLKNKVIIVSGVGPGMGQALGRIAAAEGARVVLGARNAGYLEEIAADIRAQGGEAIALSTDVTDAAQCKALAGAALDAFGRIDGLVNTAYLYGKWALMDDVDPDSLLDVYNVNCIGALRMAQAVVPAMKAQGGGAIVNVSTIGTVLPALGESSYASSKGGLNALTRHMATDYGRFSIRVNLTRMGWIGGHSVFQFIDNQVAAGRPREEVVDEITARIPLGIIPPEDDCAKAVLFFLSDYAKVVSGASLDVNGGQYMAP